MILWITLFSWDASAISSDSMLPPIDSKFRVRVNFWKRVYTEITSTQGFIHDKWKPEIIYEKVDFKTRFARKKRRIAKRAVNKIKKRFRSIIRKNLKNLSSEEQKLLELSQATTKKEIYRAMRNLRTQYGLKDNYYIGLKKSHRYLDYIKTVFKSYGLPKELVYLPHVESSFNYRAYSKVGAAGIWQFMRSTARLYGMKINYAIDERRDPFIATKAAARLLKYNYSKIGAWPLAITAYNHGLRSMQRAVKKVGSKKISEIIERYDGRRFGFASKNFYATFIATVEISENPQEYFPSFQKPAPFEYSFLPLPKALTVKQITSALGLDQKIIKLYNPSIRTTAYRSPLFLPKGFKLQLPRISEAQTEQYLSQLETIKGSTRNLRLAGEHKIRRGDSLYTLSKIYRVPIHDLIVFNNISNPSRIYPGMKIKIPGTKELKQLKDEAQTVAEVKPKKINEKPVIAEVSVKDKIEKTKSAPSSTQPQPQEKTPWYKKLLSWNKPKDESPSDPIKEEQADLDKEEKTGEIANTLVNLDNYELDLKLLSGDLYEITIETDETLGHYADWSLTRINSLRKTNRMRSRSTIRIGQKFKLRLTEEKQKRFLAERAQYHLSLQEDFFQSFEIEGTTDYVVKSGESLNQILSKNEIPLWLFRKYQDKSFNANYALKVGRKLIMPNIEKRE